MKTKRGSRCQEITGIQAKYNFIYTIQILGNTNLPKKERIFSHTKFEMKQKKQQKNRLQIIKIGDNIGVQNVRRYQETPLCGASSGPVADGEMSEMSGDTDPFPWPGKTGEEGDVSICQMMSV